MRLLAVCILAGCGFEPVVPPPAPRLIAPLSTARVSVRRPRLRWALPAGATAPRVELCRRRGCDEIAATATVDSTRALAVPDVDLAPGVWYWRVRADTPEGTGTSAVWQLVAPQRDAPRAASWGSALDLDGDGFAELAVGAPYTHDAEQLFGAGRVLVYAGGPAGPDPARVTVLSPEGRGGLMGFSLAAVDLDGDGFADLAVGAPGEVRDGEPLDHGRIHVFRGGESGLARTPLTFGLMQTHELGWSLAFAGDINADGYGDLIAGAPLTDVAGSRQGSAHIIYGGPEPGRRLQVLAGRDGSLAKHGLAVAGVGDLDGDGFDDVAVGVPDAQAGGMMRGRVWLYFGGSAGALDSPQAVESPEAARVAFGYALSGGGDLDGDGWPDWIAGSPLESGRIHMFRGGSRAQAGVPASAVDGPDGASGRFGASLAVPADADGDGLDDVLAGAPCAPATPMCGPGRAHLLHGIGAPPFASFTGPSAGALFGNGVTLGDFDGDGIADAAVGASNDQGTLGRVDVYRGGLPPSTTPLLTIVGTDAEGRFGAALR